MPKRKRGGPIDKFVTASRKPRSLALNRVEKAQVKTIAKRLDKQGKQICEANHVTPRDSGTGASYANYSFPPIPDALADLMDLMPDIAQGDNREQRLGSKIKLAAINLKFHFHIPPADAFTNANSSVVCRLLVMSPKLISKFSTLQSNWAAGENLRRQYLRDGAAATAFQGDLKSIKFPVNTALFTTHHDRTWVLRRGLLRSGGANGLTHVPDVQKHIRLSLKVKSKYCRFSGETTNQCDNYCPFAILLCAPLNGGLLAPATDGYVNGNCYVNCKWRNLM